MVTLSELNQMNQETFTNTLGEIFEHTPEIASQTWSKKPFDSLASLHQTMVEVVNQMSEQAQLKLISAHPDLGSKAKMAEASVKEQAGVGLDRLSPEKYAHFQQLNQAYKNKFSFPFIIAVKNHTPDSILESFQSRLENSLDEEKKRAIQEINQIAWFRLESLISPE